MAELKIIKRKQKAADAETIRRAIARIERMRNQDEDVLQTLLWLGDTARLIDEAFSAAAIRTQPQPPEAA